MLFSRAMNTFVYDRHRLPYFQLFPDKSTAAGAGFLAQTQNIIAGSTFLPFKPCLLQCGIEIRGTSCPLAVTDTVLSVFLIQAAGLLAVILADLAAFA